jgi:hypothetical protein
MQRGRSGFAPVAARSDRGVITVIMILWGTLATMVTVAVVATVVVIRKHNQANPNPNGYALSISKTTAFRDPFDLPIVQISYRVNFKSAANAQAQEIPVHVRCQAIGDGGTFQLDEAVTSANVFSFGESAIAPGEKYKNIEGVFKTRCWLLLTGSTLDYATGNDVDVPKATSTGGNGGIFDLDGTYALSFVRETGSTTDCAVDGTRTVAVTSLTASTVRVQLSDQDRFETTVDADLHFTGSIALNPGFVDYYGLMDAHFVRSTDGTHLAGTIKTEKPVCTFSYDAIRGHG